MELLHATTEFTRKEVKPAQTALPQSLLGPEGSHTGKKGLFPVSISLCIACIFLMIEFP